MKIGFVGLGIMGSAMAANLVKTGFKVTVWNRSADKCAPVALPLAFKQGTAVSNRSMYDHRQQRVGRW